MKQTVWDWRAAANFAGGGTGSGLAICAALATLFSPSPASQTALLLSAAFVIIGLALVGSELGRPLRGLRVFWHPKSSWMTRESFAAVALICALLGAAFSGRRELLWLAAVLAGLLLYAQARMPAAARGIPAWREPRIVPLFILTGLAEGGGVYLLLAALANANDMALYVFLLIVLRAVASASYVLHVDDASGRIRAVMSSLEFPFLGLGTVAPALLLASTPFVWPAVAQMMEALAGILTLTSGWELKFAIVTRAGFRQTFTAPHLGI